MISQETIAIVKSTAPVLAEHGETITKVFYKRMFKNNPELKDIFNMTHQKKGTQPKALANAIFQYAQHIDKLEMLSGAVESIAHKHASLVVTPAMYPIVGENLLAAIGEVLGDAATPEIVGAWTEAYEALASILINREEEMYVDSAAQQGGFRGKKEFLVLKKVKESDVITSFYLKPKDGGAIPAFTPGQYISLTLEIPNTSHKHTRNYSLSDSNDKDYWRISVKREDGDPDGIVSNYLHAHIEEGDTLWLGMPFGEFVLHQDEKPVVLLAGGVGITPLMSMYNYLAKESDRQVTFVQCALNSSTHAFKEEIETNHRKDIASIVVYDQPLGTDVYDYKGYLSLTILQNIPNIEASNVYFCGPKVFMGHCLSLLKQLNFKEEQIHYEFFGPTEDLEVEEETLV